MTTTYEMDQKFANAIFLLGGIISLVFGVLLIARTKGTIEVIMLFVGLWWLIQGLFNLLGVFIDKSQWVWKLVSGIFGVIAGLLVLNFPLAGGAIYFSFWVILMGIFGLVFGVALLIAAFQGGGLGAGLLGAVSIIIGVLMIFNSLVTVQVLLWIFAVLLIVQGAIAIYVGVTQKA